MEPIVDVIIPTLKPGKEFWELIDRLETQTLVPSRIIIMNTEEKYFERAKYGTRIRRYENVEVHHLSLREFDHGDTRNRGVRKSKAPYFVCMTQDALPADERLLENLLTPLLSGEADVSYARQLPKEGCSPVERFTKQFNYPKESRIKGSEDIPELGIKAFFCSNACAAYRRSTFDRMGGFIRRTIFNEDMIYAAGVVRAGGRIAYASQAQVLHSHNYTWKQNFHRNFDLGVSQADHPEIFETVKSESEGIRLVRQTAAYLKETGNEKLIFPMLWGSGWKFFGYKLGRNYRKLPRRFVIKCSMNRNYWHELTER
ncbi:MAG: glycosyltransferase [Lachnospiraceae bacterium]|nr:glycosyltransferase [Lachnospiraceae bacterium]